PESAPRETCSLPANVGDVERAFRRSGGDPTEAHADRGARIGDSGEADRVDRGRRREKLVGQRYAETVGGGRAVADVEAHFLSSDVAPGDQADLGRARRNYQAVARTPVVGGELPIDAGPIGGCEWSVRDGPAF